ncbi:MAG: hypothetical protein PHZ25_03290 [Candidatus Pacebacteria bacterium]|nr:hypothetical protein [Candidatus Paceibacterota bacterium]
MNKNLFKNYRYFLEKALAEENSDNKTKAERTEKIKNELISSMVEIAEFLEMLDKENKRRKIIYSLINNYLIDFVKDARLYEALGEKGAIISDIIDELEAASDLSLRDKRPTQTAKEIKKSLKRLSFS